ncbi:hypothetical protein [Brachybacterium paraconglomeratum]|uniref:hypothetical protein n=1 Tax=Brachybacterium paraconglomeratum TaxID=173362 RepID=UPI00249156C9|nr:hypothetical protein [Brachybacterium paraconglomeratum]
MARKSTKAAEARERARERANRFLEREQELLRIAERFEEAQLEVEGVDAATEAKVAKIREQAEARIAEAREQAEKDAAEARRRSEELQREMLALGINRREVGERLGISTRSVVRTEGKKPVKKLSDEEAEAAALVREGVMIQLDGDVHRQLSPASADGTELHGMLYQDGEEQGEATVDLATAEWSR